MTEAQILIEHRFEGFGEVALGGYVAGVLAERIGPAATVRLRSPVPIGTRLERAPGESGCWVLRNSRGVFAEGWAETSDIDVPTGVSLTEAREASARYPGLNHHLFPGCFCCGPARSEGDGL